MSRDLEGRLTLPHDPRRGAATLTLVRRSTGEAFVVDGSELAALLSHARRAHDIALAWAAAEPTGDVGVQVPLSVAEGGRR